MMQKNTISKAIILNISDMDNAKHLLITAVSYKEVLFYQASI